MKVVKDDQGKVKLSLTPGQIIRDVALVREYGVKKYHDPDNWKKVELERYIDAFYRHWLAFVEDNGSIDEESGIEHYKHAACNMAFICELMKKRPMRCRAEGFDPKNIVLPKPKTYLDLVSEKYPGKKKGIIINVECIHNYFDADVKCGVMADCAECWNRIYAGEEMKE